MLRHSLTTWTIRLKRKSVGSLVKTMQESTLNDTTPPTSYTVTLEEDGDDLLLPLPEEIIKNLGWNEGDELEWSVNNNTIILRKAHD